MHYSSHHHALSPRNNLPDTRSQDAYLQQKPSAADMPSRPQQRPQPQGFNFSPLRVDEYASHHHHHHHHQQQQQQQQQQQLYYQQSRSGGDQQQPLDYYYSTLQSNSNQQEPFDDPDALINWSSVPRSSYSNTNSPEISRPFTPVYDSFATTHNSPYIQTPSSSFPNQSPISVSATVEKLNSTFPIPLPPNSYYTTPGTTTNPQSSPFSFSFLPDSPFSSNPPPLAASPKDNVVMPPPTTAFNIDSSWQFNDISSASILPQPTGIHPDQVWSELHHIPSSSPPAFDPSAVKLEQSTPERHSLPLAMSPTLLMLAPGLADSHPGNEQLIKEEHTMSPHFGTPSPQYEESYDNYTSESDTPNPVNFIPPPFPSVSQSTLSSGSVPSRNGAGRRPAARNTASSSRVDWNIQKKSRGRHVPTIKAVYGTVENALEVVDAMAAAGVKNDRPYLCACGLCFQRNEHLKRHQNSIHSNVKPFACPAKDCNKSFSRRDNLFQHLHVHRKEDIPHGYQLPNARKRSPT